MEPTLFWHFCCWIRILAYDTFSLPDMPRLSWKPSVPCFSIMMPFLMASFIFYEAWLISNLILSISRKVDIIHQKRHHNYLLIWAKIAQRYLKKIRVFVVNYGFNPEILTRLCKNGQKHLPIFFKKKIYFSLTKSYSYQPDLCAITKSHKKPRNICLQI